MKLEAGFKSRLIDQLNPLPSPRVYAQGHDVTISWDKGDGFTGGEIYFSPASRILFDGSPVSKEAARIIVSSISTYPNFDMNFIAHRNPREGVSALLTMVATLNRAAIIKQMQILHLVRANHKSAPFFEKLVQVGVYYYCDQNGNYANQTLTVGYERQTLFACRFPIQTEEEVLTKFVNELAAKYLSLRSPSAT